VSGAAQNVLLYDEDCGFCKWSLNKILAWDRAKRVRPVPIQSEEGSRLLARVPPDARLDSWHLVRADGSLFSAGAAAAPLARLLPGGRPLAAAFAAFPGATERAYRFVARNRGRLARLLHVDPNCQVRRRPDDFSAPRPSDR
jgi:predicted DCC family thiol-disulfide oxidoreductase YuxK